MILFLLVVCSSANLSLGSWEGETRIVSSQVLKDPEEPINLPDYVHVKTPDDKAGTKQYHVLVQKSLVPMKLVVIRKVRVPSLLDILSDRLRHISEPKSVPIHAYVERKVVYPMEKTVPVPMKEYVEVPKPYPVPVLVEKKVPVIMEKKVPVKVEVPVEKPYPVEVAVPYEVTIVKKVPFVVERKVPYQVNVPQFVEVPVPMFENKGEESVGSAKPKNKTVSL